MQFTWKNERIFNAAQERLEECRSLLKGEASELGLVTQEEKAKIFQMMFDYIAIEHASGLENSHKDIQVHHGEVFLLDVSVVDNIKMMRDAISMVQSPQGG